MKKGSPAGHCRQVLQEFVLESTTTRRLLERVAADQLNWKLHPKSGSVGQLALHVAIGRGLIGEWALQDLMEMPDWGDPSAAWQPDKLEAATSHRSCRASEALTTIDPT